ncbi:hypothetical protein PTTG_25590 [Puccinia triticina 1-1 BBBD Race 1]|uniref:Large ribosomal subunit protein mL49 n=2 Tax=Puccinia triticina TaxID=208348 RepID=A0A0C4EM21_PUCT1|nr:uncharacterized protein PtA15_11A606 [Puccinia triticina]OAV98560.1 hypothetical protein PTTG_25590 [Puccinia triticina 1-1 BBBD Race 1]WAQ89914.1 hypothetical protein PtA15_11A606 [Puccinia triticina]WAR59960.1 hypothetical protein PtB15_11B601 [Puccinia triticina]
MASAGPRTLYRMVSKPLALRSALCGYYGLPESSAHGRWSSSVAQEKPTVNDSIKSSKEPRRITHNSNGQHPPKKVYEFNIPDRVWKAPITTEQNPLKYSITRTTPYNTLPVYSVMKPGLGQIWTLIKRINGDLYKLKEDLILDFPQSQPILKLHVNQVLCRGHITKEIKLWLQDRGF